MNTSNLYKELSYCELKPIIKKHFNQDEFEFSLLKGGMFNTTYLIFLISTGVKYVLRLGPINRQLLLPYELNLMNGEKYFYELCAKEHIPFSKIIVCETDKLLIDRDYMIVEYIDSSSLSEISMSGKDKDKLYRDVGKYTENLHHISGTKFGRLSELVNGNGFDKWSEFLISENNQLAVSVQQAGVFTSCDVYKVKEILLQYSEVLDEISVPKLVHADLWEGNVLISSQNDNYDVAAIIDGDRALFGDIDYDFASGWMINEAFLVGYGTSISTDNHSLIRKQIYSMMIHLTDTYVWKVEYNNEENSLSNRKVALELISNLSAIPKTKMVT